SITPSSTGGLIVGSCDVWGMGDKFLIYFTESGMWLKSELGFGGDVSYSQGYHLFRVQLVGGGPCMTPDTCFGQVPELVEEAISASVSIDLRAPETWCR